MCVLNINSRPFVLFNAEDYKHRAYFKRYLETKSWKDCPVQFYIEGGRYDLVSMIQEKLLEFYMNKDKKVVKEANKYE